MLGLRRGSQHGIGVAAEAVEAAFGDVVEDRVEAIEVALANRVVLVVVTLAQATVRPSQTVDVVLTRSTMYAFRYSSAIAPPSKLIMWLRLKPLAIFWVGVAFGKRSPASCSMVKRSNGRFVLNESMT